jgi:hypothetical protein
MSAALANPHDQGLLSLCRSEERMLCGPIAANYCRGKISHFSLLRKVPDFLIISGIKITGVNDHEKMDDVVCHFHSPAGR